VPTTVAPGELGALAGRRVAVVGIAEVGDYDAESTAQSLNELHGVQAFPAEVSLKELPGSASLSDLYGRRAPAVPEARGAPIAYPPGFTNLGQDAFELLASPPAPHGWRLQQAIGLGSLPGQVTAFESARGHLTSVRAGDRTLRGDAFVLASGHHIGGGLVGGRVTTEPIFGLGVWHDGQAVAVAGTRLQHLQYIDAGEAMKSGVATDRELHPLDGEGQVAYDNLFAAGALLGGYEYAGDCGFGVPLLTGWLAGRWAARSNR